MYESPAMQLNLDCRRKPRRSWDYWKVHRSERRWLMHTQAASAWLGVMRQMCLRIFPNDWVRKILSMIPLFVCWEQNLSQIVYTFSFDLRYIDVSHDRKWEQDICTGCLGPVLQRDGAYLLAQRRRSECYRKAPRSCHRHASRYARYPEEFSRKQVSFSKGYR